jgi:hypothetical protein
MNHITVTFKLDCKASHKFERFLKKNEYVFEVTETKEWFGDLSYYVTRFDIEYNDDNSKQKIIDTLHTLKHVLEIN